MSRKILRTAIMSAVAGAGLGIAVSNCAMAAGAPSNADVLAVAPRLGITEYEQLDQAGGCGAPEKNLLDNDLVRVDLVSFPTGFDRCGKLKRRYNQLLVYIDEGDYTITWNGVMGKEVPVADQKHSHLAPGSAVYHPKDSVVSVSHIDQAYRVLFIQMKSPETHDITEAAKAAAKLGITAYEKRNQAGGCGAPEKNLLDNDQVRVDMVSFQTGFNRCGMLKRRYNQLLVYIDTGNYTITRSGGSGKEIPPEKQKHSHLAPGTVVYHPKDTVVSNSHIDQAYRVLFVQVKK